ncbi:MAG: hypothetical protein ACI84K_000640 [Pseudohongiellaceae bacterium]|jgi:hypothetical protein
MYLDIEDSSQSLNEIKKKLNTITADHPTEIYYSQITLGLYRDNFSTRKIANRIKIFRLKSPPNLPPIKVSEVVYCQYETNVLQDPFRVEHRIKLN